MAQLTCSFRSAQTFSSRQSSIRGNQNKLQVRSRRVMGMALRCRPGIHTNVRLSLNALVAHCSSTRAPRLW